ncbi:MAG: Rrf2 family transcriptional regulator [Clostridiales bacterium]
MRITQEGDYALRVVLYLCKENMNEPKKSKIISEHEKIPLRFLLKLFRKLNKAGIIKSFRGAEGGYSIAKSPDKITLKDIIEAIDGPIFINRCIYDADFCNLNRTNTCDIHHALLKIQKRLVEDLENITIDNVIKGEVQF